TCSRSTPASSKSFRPTPTTGRGCARSPPRRANSASRPWPTSSATRPRCRCCSAPAWTMSPATSWLRPVRTWATTSSKARAGTARAVPPVPSGQEALAQGGLAVDAAGLERADALFQRRVAEHQPAQAVAHRTADAESRDLLGQGVLALVERQALQRRDHLRAAGQRGAA